MQTLKREGIRGAAKAGQTSCVTTSENSGSDRLNVLFTNNNAMLSQNGIALTQKEVFSHEATTFTAEMTVRSLVANHKFLMIFQILN